MSFCPTCQKPHDKADTRAHILRVAKALFEAGGYDAVTLRGVATLAGCSTGAIFAHWPGKDALFAEAMGRRSRHLALSGRDPAGEGGGAGVKIELNIGWTEERTERAKRMWTEGKSAREIANDLGGVTRNAVIGKLTRLGLAGNVGVSTTGERVARRGPSTAPTRLVAPKPEKQPKPEKVTMIASRPPVDFKALAKVGPTAPSPLMLKVTQLNTRTCKWPIGEVESAHFGFCGHRVMQGQPYCPAHCKAAFRPADKKENAKALARSLRRFL